MSINMQPIEKSRPLLNPFPLQLHTYIDLAFEIEIDSVPCEAWEGGGL